ncbi:hypothetical protein [Companilactobacillus mishanensis]|uniref:Uncharacterized protein n=1 Tax=Companilactobacillus mishanensis TaxID=2486008 RepID=A0A5P0ZKG5_9LACO|nr:hypothetical protein [Companilactobacillus mishanensis]MQS53548.1 hypothetical protein [Companilactobacillus mishanensis]
MGTKGAAALDVGFNAGAEYIDQKGKKNVGMAIQNGAIDTVTSIGPVSGAMYGAEFGPFGAAIGGVAGTAMAITKFIDPKIGSHLKGDLKGTNKVIGKINDSAKSNIRSFVDSQKIQNEAI